jgi:carbamoyltransferase
MVKREVVVLGINDGHDAGAALIKDGNVVAAVQEERLNNIKHYAGIPEKSINEVFKISKIHPFAVSLVVLVSYDPPGQEDLNAFSTKLLLKLGPLLHSKPYIKVYSSYKKLRRNVKGIMKCLEKLELTSVEITIIEHQKAHASAAYRSSPWGYHNHQNNGQTLILTADGSGDGLSSTVNIGTVGEIVRIASSSYYDSLGNAFYTEITRYLGLKPWDHENKVMGLAPYGKASHCIQKMREIINIDKRNPLVFKNRIGCVGIYVQPKLRKLLANQRFDNIAAAAQQHLEELVKSWVLSAVKSTGVKRLALAGGIFLNVKLNKLLRETEDIEEIFIYPAPDDEGNAVGAALEGYFEYCRREGIKPNHVPISQTYYGPTFENEEIKFMLKNRLDNNHWKYDYYDDIDSLAGELLTKGKIIARCSGRLEWGPRALGNRSIIADPRDSGVIHKINFAIKQRDFWMPFAPSILEERTKDYLTVDEFAPYMIMAFDTVASKDGKNEIPAVVHPYDNTCRPQTVRESWNKSYYNLMEAFESMSGIGAVLNTSFNLHGFPMVGTPEMAIWTFSNSKLDALVLGNYLISK